MTQEDEKWEGLVTARERRADGAQEGKIKGEGKPMSRSI